MGMGRLITIGRVIKALPTITALVGVKYALWKLYQHGRAGREQRLQANRRQFGALPRVYQRGVLSARRAQLSDLEGIYRAGYSPRPRAFAPVRPGRRRRWF